jgi:hypothetical protein
LSQQHRGALTTLLLFLQLLANRARRNHGGDDAFADVSCLDANKQRQVPCACDNTAGRFFTI